VVNYSKTINDLHLYKEKIKIFLMDFYPINSKMILKLLLKNLFFSTLNL